VKRIPLFKRRISDSLHQKPILCPFLTIYYCRNDFACRKSSSDIAFLSLHSSDAGGEVNKIHLFNGKIFDLLHQGNTILGTFLTIYCCRNDSACVACPFSTRKQSFYLDTCPGILTGEDVLDSGACTTASFVR
jgi:hypothetical protein